MSRTGKLAGFLVSPEIRYQSYTRAKMSDHPVSRTSGLPAPRMPGSGPEIRLYILFAEPNCRSSGLLRMSGLFTYATRCPGLARKSGACIQYRLKRCRTSGTGCPGFRDTRCPGIMTFVRIVLHLWHSTSIFFSTHFPSRMSV